MKKNICFVNFTLNVVYLYSCCVIFVFIFDFMSSYAHIILLGVTDNSPKGKEFNSVHDSLEFILFLCLI